MITLTSANVQNPADPETLTIQVYPAIPVTPGASFEWIEEIHLAGYDWVGDRTTKGVDDLTSEAILVDSAGNQVGEALTDVYFTPVVYLEGEFNRGQLAVTVKMDSDETSALSTGLNTLTAAAIEVWAQFFELHDDLPVRRKIMRVPLVVDSGVKAPESGTAIQKTYIAGGVGASTDPGNPTTLVTGDVYNWSWTGAVTAPEGAKFWVGCFHESLDVIQVYYSCEAGTGNITLSIDDQDIGGMSGLDLNATKTKAMATGSNFGEDGKDLFVTLNQLLGCEGIKISIKLEPPSE